MFHHLCSGKKISGPRSCHWLMPVHLPPRPHPCRLRIYDPSISKLEGMKITRILQHSVYILPGFSWSSNLPHEQTDQTWAKNLSSTFFDINSIFVYAQLSKIFCKIYITLWNPQIPSTVSYLGRLPCSFGDTSLWQSSHNFWSAEFSDLPASAIISRHCLLTSLTSALAQFIYVSIWKFNPEFF